jgi:beta-lactamase regulating signal transducer with metallopeptidase domain
MEKFVDILIEISVYSAVITACILLFRLLFKKRISPRVQYAVWMLLVLRLMLPVTVESGFHVESLLPEKPASLVEQESIFETETPVINLAPSDHAQTDSPLVPSEPAPVVLQEMLEPAPVRDISWRLIAFWVWIAGAMVFGLWMMIVKLRFYEDMQRHIATVSPRVYAIYEECCDALHVKPMTVWAVDRSISPGIAFFSGPVLLLPASMVGSEDALRYAFLHELTHKKRYDHYVTALLTVLRVIYWFNPAVHVGFNEMRADMETACDADVIAFVGKQQKRGYLNTIIELFSYATNPQLGMSQASSRRMAKRRMKGAFMRERTTIFGKAAVLMLVLVMLLGCFTTACQSAPEKMEDTITEAPENLQSADVYGQENETTTPELAESLSETQIDLDGDGLADTVTMENRSPSDTNISPEEAKVILTVDLGKGAKISHEIPGWWWPENCCTADFDADGKTDIALMLGAGGSNYGATKVFVYRLEGEQLVEYPENMIRNDAISYDQSMFVMLNDANWVSGGTVVTEGQKSMLRLRHLLDYDPGAGITTAYYTNLSWTDNGWFVESMEIGEAYGEEQVSPGSLQPVHTLSPEQTTAEVFLTMYFDKMCDRDGVLDYCLNKADAKNGQLLLISDNRNDMMLLRQWIDYKAMLTDFGYNIERDCGRFSSLDIHSIDITDNGNGDCVLKGYFKTTAFGTFVELGMTNVGNGKYAITSVAFPDWKEYNNFCDDFISFMEENGYQDYGKSVYIDAMRKERFETNNLG